MNQFLFCLVCLLVSAQLSLAKESPATDIQAKQSIAAIAKEIQSSKTVREWIDKAPKKIKIFRRIHFSDKLSEPMPMVLMSKNSLVIIPKNKKPKSRVSEQHLLEAKVENGKIVYYLNRKNISRHSQESLDQWYNRLFKVQQKPKKNASLNSFLFNQAHAEPLSWDKLEGKTDSSQRAYWSAIAASMTADEWQASDPIQTNSFAAVDTSTKAQEMAQYLNLSCDSEKKARFDFEVNPPDGSFYRIESFLDRSSQPPKLRLIINNHPNSGMPSSGKQLARLAIPVDPAKEGRSDVIYSFDHRNGDLVHTTEPQNGEWTLGRVFYAMEVRHPGETEDVRSRESFTNFADYMPYAQELLVMADVANAVCTNKVLQEDSGTPSNVVQ